MIPHRMLSNEISGNGLKERVTACRKRVRENRVKNHATSAAGDSSLQSSSSCAPQLAAFEPVDFNRGGLLAEEQEVGIT
jgi:hypothetical protein